VYLFNKKEDDHLFVKIFCPEEKDRHVKLIASRVESDYCIVGSGSIDTTFLIDKELFF